MSDSVFFFLMMLLVGSLIFAICTCGILLWMTGKFMATTANNGRGPAGCGHGGFSSFGPSNAWQAEADSYR
jgi:hypothetical protein